MRKHEQKVKDFVREIEQDFGMVIVKRDVLTIYRGNVSDDIFDDVLWKFQMAVYGLCDGHSWGTDGIGYLSNKSQHFVEVHKVLPKAIRNEFLKQLKCLEKSTGWEVVEI